MNFQTIFLDDAKFVTDSSSETALILLNAALKFFALSEVIFGSPRLLINLLSARMKLSVDKLGVSSRCTALVAEQTNRQI